MPGHPPPLPDVEELLNPSPEAALGTAGMLIHYIASDPGRVAAFTAWIEHCPGDLTRNLVAAVLEATHRVLEPGCDYPAATSLEDMESPQ